MSSPRLCLIGYGAIAAHHARIFRSEGAVLNTVVGRAPEETARFAAEFAFEHQTNDLELALSKRALDAVVVASPNGFHYQHARQALLAGKHVLCEIPLSMSYPEAVELVELATRQRCALMVAHSQRFNPILLTLRQRVAEGSLHIHHLTGRDCFLRRSNVGWTGRQRSWTDSILWHHGGHFIDGAMWLLGATSVEVQSNLAEPDARTGSPLDLDVLLRTPAGQLASLSLSYHAQIRSSEYFIVAEEDTFHYGGGVLRGSKGVVMETKGLSGGDEVPAWEAQDHEFLAALRDGRAPASSGADILPALAVLQQVQDHFAKSSNLESAGRQRE